MATLDGTGLLIDTYAQIKAAIEASELATIDSQLNLTASSVIGQLNAIFSAKLSQLEEALQAVYDQLNPDSATGSSLDILCALFPGITRTTALKAYFFAAITIPAGYYNAGDLVMASSADPTLRYLSEAFYTDGSPGGTVRFTAETAGAAWNQAMASFNSTTHPEVIAQPYPGWTYAVATEDAKGGADAETDAELRLRRAQELRRTGGSHVDSILASVRGVGGVESALVEENDTDVTVGIITPHAIHVTYWDGSGAAVDTETVALAIYSSKAAGIGTVGGDSELIEDDNGLEHEIFFDRATAKRLIVTYTGLVIAATAPSTYMTDIENRLLAYINGGYDMDGTTLFDGLGIGGDVIAAKVYSMVISIPWVSDVTDVQVCWYGGTPGSSNLTVTSSEVAQLASEDILNGD